MKKLSKLLLLVPAIAMLLCGCDKNEDHIPVESVSLDAVALEMRVDEQKKINATVNPSNATNKAITWETSEKNVAQVIGGLVTAYSPGETDITVKTKDGGKTASCHIVVKEKDPHIEPVSGVVLNQESLTIKPGATFQLVATVLPSTAENKNVTFSTSNSGVANVDNHGLISALTIGTSVITVTTEDGGFTASCAVSVSDIDPTIHVTGISLPNHIDLFMGATSTLTPTITPKNATNKKVTWSSADETYVKVDQNGVLTPVQITTSSIAITATTEDGGLTATTYVAVNEALPDAAMIISRSGTSVVQALTKVTDEGASGTEYKTPDNFNFVEGDKVIFKINGTQYGSNLLKQGGSKFVQPCTEALYSQYLYVNRTSAHTMYVETNSELWADGKAIWVSVSEYSQMYVKSSSDTDYSAIDLTLNSPSETEYTVSGGYDFHNDDVFYFSINEVDYKYENYKGRYSSPNIVNDSISGNFKSTTDDHFVVFVETVSGESTTAGVYLKGDNDPEIMHSYLYLKHAEGDWSKVAKLVKNGEKDEYTFEENAYYDFKEGDVFTFCVDIDGADHWYSTPENAPSFFTTETDEGGNTNIKCLKDGSFRVYVKPETSNIYFERDPEQLENYMLIRKAGASEETKVSLYAGETAGEYIFKDGEYYDFTKNDEFAFHIETTDGEKWIKTIQNTGIDAYFTQLESGNQDIQCHQDCSFRVFVKYTENAVWFEKNPATSSNYMLIRKAGGTEETQIKLVASETPNQYIFEENAYYSFTKDDEFAFHIEGTSGEQWIKSVENPGAFFEIMTSGNQDIKCLKDCSARVYVKSDSNLVYFERDPETISAKLFSKASGGEWVSTNIVESSKKGEYIMPDNQYFSFVKGSEYYFYIENGTTVSYIKTIENTNLGSYINNSGENGNISCIKDIDLHFFVKVTEEKIWFEFRHEMIVDGGDSVSLTFKDDTAEYMLKNYHFNVGDKVKFNVFNRLHEYSDLKSTFAGWEDGGNGFIKCKSAGNYSFFIENKSSGEKTIWIDQQVTYNVTLTPTPQNNDTYYAWAWVGSNPGSWIQCEFSYSSGGVYTCTLTCSTSITGVLIVKTKEGKTPNWEDETGTIDMKTSDIAVTPSNTSIVASLS